MKKIAAATIPYMTTRNESPLERFKRKFLSDATGINTYTLGRIIRGERKPTKTELIALSTVTGLSIESLSLEVEDEKKAS
jgi:preprotein translocase subunit Sss1